MIVVFDLDGTLARLGEATEPECVELLRRIRESGARIALSSGKPTFYLCGYARQLGLCDAFLIGENGAVIVEGVGLPPARFEMARLPEKTKKALKELREKMEAAFPDGIWYQPNETALTPFPYRQDIFPPLRKMLEDYITPEMELAVYEHSDCFDVEYSALDKGVGLMSLARITGTPTEEMIAVGDWTNDYPMFRVAGYSVGIRLPEPERASVNFPTLKEALLHILERIKK